MNPRPTLAQCLVLHEVDDGTVWFDMVTGKWHTTYGKGVVSVQMECLLRGGYITISGDLEPVAAVTPLGRQALDRRPWGELVEKVNSR